MIMPPLLYIIYSVNMVLNVTWLILWDRELMPAGLGVIIAMALTLMACLALSYHAVYTNTPSLIRYKLTKEVSGQRYVLMGVLWLVQIY